MSQGVAWLASREPTPPPTLAARLRLSAADERLDRALAAVARARLDEARVRPGRVRESAFRLLEADALLTYACEAALDTEDSDSALLDVLAAAG